MQTAQIKRDDLRFAPLHMLRSRLQSVSCNTAVGTRKGTLERGHGRNPILPNLCDVKVLISVFLICRMQTKLFVLCGLENDQCYSALKEEK